MTNLVANDVITKARFTLADTNKTRWTDERLLSLLNDSLLDLSLTTNLYDASGYIKLESGRASYNMSSQVHQLNRIEYNNIPLLLITYKEADEQFSTGWQDDEFEFETETETETGTETETETETGTGTETGPTHIIYNLSPKGNFRLYPILKGDFVDNDLSIIDVIDDIDELDKYIKIYYVATPEVMNTINSKLDRVISRTMLSSLAHYIAGYAFRDNSDPQNIKIGNEEIAYYQISKKELSVSEMSNNAKRIRRSDYDTIFGY